MLTLRSFFFSLIITIVISAASTDVFAETVRITTQTEFGSLNGQTIYVPKDQLLGIRAVVEPSDPPPSGTYQWSFTGPHQVNGLSTNRLVEVKWTARGNYTATVVYNGTISATVNVVVTIESDEIELTPRPCSEESQAPSTGLTFPTWINFKNYTTRPLKYFWINPAGQRVLYATFPSGYPNGYSIYQPMWVGNTYVVTDENDNCMGIYTGIPQTGRASLINVKNVQFERILPDSESLTLNPNAEGGRRFYPDKKQPGETAVRNQVRVKATVSRYVPNTKVYFRSFDVDDPSASTAPVDDDSTNPNAEDNRGMVGTSKAGQLESPASPACTRDRTTNLWGCPVDSNSVAVINFTTTMHPGDNFAVAASLDASYLSGLAVNGINLKDASQQTLPIPPEPNPTTPYALARGARSEMLTVWRKLHIEVDTMGAVSGNSVTGTLPGAAFLMPPTSPVPNDIINVATTANPLPLQDDGRFMKGRLVINGDSYEIIDNNTTTLQIKVVTGKRYRAGDSFTLYDDDDFNNNQTPLTLIGDNGEPIVQLPESLRYLTNQDGNNPDGTPKNVYAASYIVPDYNWAISKNYNQTNVTFNLNLESRNASNDPLNLALNNSRGSKNDERDDFWIGYFLMAYQGNSNEDADGGVTNPQTRQFAPDKGNTGITAGIPPDQWCDCYQSLNCPAAIPPNVAPRVCSILPRGGFGSAIYLEVNQDIHRSWLAAGTNLRNIEVIAPHELGHQFGLLGDQPQITLKLMDYSVYPNTINDVALHPEHINLIRWRVKSPGA